MEACDYDYEPGPEDDTLDTAMDSSEIAEQTSGEPAGEPEFDMVSVRDILSPEPEDKMSLPMAPDDNARDDSQTKLGMPSTASTMMNAVTSSVEMDHENGSSELEATIQNPAKTGSCHSSGAKQAQRPLLAAKSGSFKQPQTAPETDVAELTFKCSNGFSFTTSVNVAQTTVLKLKEIVQKESGFSVQRQNLLFKGKTLSPDRATLKSLKVSTGIIQVAEVNYGG